MSLSVRQWPVLRLIQVSKTPLEIKNRINSPRVEVIPGQRGKRSVGWLAGPQTLINTIFYGQSTCMSLSVRQWPVLRLIQDSKTPLRIKTRNIAACFQFIPGQRGE